MIHAFGFPRWRGGPMMQADLTGLLAVENRLRGYAGHGPDFWQPAPLFDGLVKNGLSFASMNLV
jgi:3-hydroxyacyl-CoA dehydrogenase